MKYGLTDEERDEIRRLYESTKELPERLTMPNPDRWSLDRLGKRYGVSRETIRRVVADDDATNPGEEPDGK